MFFVVGNPSPDLYGAIRPGDNLYTDSIVAVDLDTARTSGTTSTSRTTSGTSTPSARSILTQAKDKYGKMIDVAIHGGKTGHVYVHDRNTGKLIRFSEAMIPQENMWVLPTKDGARMLPGANGGVEWSPMAINPKLRMAYAANLHQPMTYHVEEAAVSRRQAVARRRVQDDPEREAMGAPGRRQPRHRQGRVGLRRPTQPLIGGVLATAGDLVFNGEATAGSRPSTPTTGKELWKYQCGAGVNAPAVSYMVDGKQYVAVAAGGNNQIDFKRGNSVFVFALP